MGVSLLLTGLVASAGDLHGFSFVTPEGFVSLNGPGPFPELAEGDAQMLEHCKALEACAVKLRDGAVVASMSANVRGGSPPLLDLAGYMTKVAATQPTIKNFKIVSSRIERIGGVDCGRVETEWSLEGVEQRDLYYFMPNSYHWAFVRLSSAGDDYLPASRQLDAAALKTGGLADSSHGSTPAKENDHKTGAVIAAAALGGLLVGKWLRRPRPRRPRH